MSPPTTSANKRKGKMPVTTNRLIAPRPPLIALSLPATTNRAIAPQPTPTAPSLPTPAPNFIEALPTPANFIEAPRPPPNPRPRLGYTHGMDNVPRAVYEEYLIAPDPPAGHRPFKNVGTGAPSAFPPSALPTAHARATTRGTSMEPVSSSYGAPSIAPGSGYGHAPIPEGYAHEPPTDEAVRASVFIRVTPPEPAQAAPPQHGSPGEAREGKGHNRMLDTIKLPHSVPAQPKQTSAIFKGRVDPPGVLPGAPSHDESLERYKVAVLLFGEQSRLARTPEQTGVTAAMVEETRQRALAIWHKIP